MLPDVAVRELGMKHPMYQWLSRRYPLIDVYSEGARNAWRKHQRALCRRKWLDAPIPPPRGLGPTLSEASARDLIRRLPSTTPGRRSARELARVGQTLKALELLASLHDVSEKHVEAHKQWLDEQNSIV